MSIKSEVFAVTAALTVAGSVGAAGLLAPAASATTTSCGNNCFTLFNRTFGRHIDPAEDFVLSAQGTVSDFYEAGLVSSSLVLHYGGGCATLRGCLSPDAPDDFAFEMEYAPYGVQSGLCAGVATTAWNQTPISLQPCGVSSRTVWVSDTNEATDCDGRGGAGGGYVPLINGSDTNLSHPYVMTYPENGYPTDRPRPQLFTRMLNGFSQPGGINPFDPPNTVDDHQLWGLDGGSLGTGNPVPGCPPDNRG